MPDVKTASTPITRLRQSFSHLDDAGGCYVWRDGQFFPSNLENELKLIEDFTYTLDPGVFLSRSRG
jgi:hypothetical protein